MKHIRKILTDFQNGVIDIDNAEGQIDYFVMNGLKEVKNGK